MEIYWFVALMASVCFEGLGRKYAPQIPSFALYFLKDVVLLIGFVFIRPPRSIQRAWKNLYRGFGIVWLVALLWTVLEIFNPSHQSGLLALIGLRAYWLWWVAPVLIATVVLKPGNRRRALYVLSTFTISIAALAALQFVSPADSALNLYSVVDGESVYAAGSGIVFSTGRARVSSTFAYLTGFQDFAILVPALLLSLGLETPDTKLRNYSLAATLVAASVIPMSGSRSAVILGVLVLLLTSWSAGLLFTAAGRRIMVGAIAAMVLASVAFPDAMLGVESRFEGDETQERFLSAASVLPPVALLTLDYPAMGIGTGMEQNAKAVLHVQSEWDTELESHRVLVELGPVGFCLIWVTKLGLMIALLRSYRILQRANRRAVSGAALSLAAVTFFGDLAFDHVWQALFFTACGFVLAEIVKASEEQKAYEEQLKRASLVADPSSSGAAS
jgi:hypothetical protein